MLTILGIMIPTFSFAKVAPASFAGVAKKAIPAVVSVKVEMAGPVQNPFFGYLDKDEEAPDFFNDEFFRRFFNMPKKQSPSEIPRQIGQGSGFLISEDGHILTNNHIVQNADKILVYLNNQREYRAKIVGRDPSSDVAVLKIEGDHFPYLELGNSNELEVGEWVLAVGNPLGLQATVTAGVVSAVDRSNLGLNQIEDFIQTDAAINRGNSGGPLMNLEEKVIGMNTAIATHTGGYMGIGFAIPSSMISQITEQLINNGSFTRGYLGVLMQQIDQDLANAFGLDEIKGALVAEVAKNSPADKAGLKRGDIILKYNGKEVKSISVVRNAVSMMKPEEKVRLVVKRGGRLLNISVVVGSHPANLKTQNKTTNSLGIQVQELTPELEAAYGYRNEEGVVVSTVDPGSIAALTGIKKGALIISVNHQEVNTPDAFYAQLKNTEEGKPVLLLVRQGEFSQYISLRVE